MGLNCNGTDLCVSEWLNSYNGLLGRVSEKDILLTVRFLSEALINLISICQINYDIFLKFLFETNISDETQTKLNEFNPFTNKLFDSTKKVALELLKYNFKINIKYIASRPRTLTN